ncbi:MAG: serine hydrolase domain-containing protein [Pirellulaceae bacterium]
MSMIRLSVSCLTLWWLGTGCVLAQQTVDLDLISRIDEYVTPLVEAGHLSGTLLVAHGDVVLYERSWGLADREQNRPFDPETPSCIASVTKPTTVILAARLIEDGTISLRDPVSKWLDDFPQGDQMQVQHLLFHRAGIPHRLTNPEEENVPRSAADMVELARATPLDFEPGKGNRYSSGGYAVLVRVLELASGKTYEQLLSETILEPLALQHTIHPGPGVQIENAARSYSWTREGQQPAAEKDYSFLIGAGALFSTPRDMWAIARALVNEEFGPTAKRRLLRGGRLGWNGITNNFRAYLEYDSQTDLTVALVSNQMTGANDLVRQNIPRIVAGEDVPEPQVPQPEFISVPAEVLERYAGQYDIGGPMPVRFRDGALYANDWMLLPISETRFFSPQDYATVEVVLDDDNPVALDWAGMECKRLGPLDDRAP